MKRLIVAISLILAALFLFNACAQSEKPETPTAAPTENSQPAAEPTDTEPTATEPAVTEPAVTEATETEPIIPDPEPDWFAEAVSFSDLPTSKTPVRYGDFKYGTLTGDTTIKALVIFTSYTDGLTLDKEKFEKTFNGVYGYNECLRSLASYYKFSSYGKITFDFKFVYYDSDMTCLEAWHYVHDEDENGFFRGNDYIIDIINEIRSENKEGIDYKDLDGDGDGFIDLVYFVGGEDSEKIFPDEHYLIFAGSSGVTSYYDGPDYENPTLKRFIKVPYDYVKEDLESGYGSSAGARVLIHETGHALGLPDYYTSDGSVDTLGRFDMMHSDYMDHNPFSKYALGFIEPYVVEDVEDEITIKIRASALNDETILIPTSKGWNGTAFDEYILIDVMAPIGGNAFDWKNVTDEWYAGGEVTNKKGGVRIYHVDARLQLRRYTDEDGWTYSVLDDPVEAIQYKNDSKTDADTIFINSNNIIPEIEGESQYYHLIEIVPSDRSDRFRMRRTDWLFFSANDLYGVGDTFVLDDTNESFVNAPYMNNGGTLDYSVTVRAYDEKTHEAVITIKRINTEN